MKKNAFLLVVITFMFFSCQNKEQKLLNQITELETVFAADTLGLPDINSANALIDAYDNFSKTYPSHSKTPEFIFNAGRYCMSYNQAEKAVGFFERLIENHPDYEKLPDSYFLKAFVYDSQMNNIPKARAAYETLIEKYPDHPLAQDAEHLISLLGKSLEDIIAEFEAKNNMDTLVLN